MPVNFAVKVDEEEDDETAPYNEKKLLHSFLDQPVVTNEYVNNIYISLTAVNILVAFHYMIAWRGRSWLDVILIPEYLKHIQAGLYLCYYTMAVHRIELCVAVDWMVSWYMTYIRTLGRGFTLDDPNTMGYLTTTTNTLIYLVYNIRMNVYPEENGNNQIFTYVDIFGFIGSVYYILGTLRDENVVSPLNNLNTIEFSTLIVDTVYINALYVSN